MTPKFAFYEKVRIESNRPLLASIQHELGAVLGMAQNVDGRWSYGVSIYSQGIVWSCEEDDLVSTGEFDCRESFYSGESIRVSQKGELLS